MKRQRAIVLYEPMNNIPSLQSRSPFSLSVNSDFLSRYKSKYFTPYIRIPSFLIWTSFVQLVAVGELWHSKFLARLLYGSENLLTLLPTLPPLPPPSKATTPLLWWTEPVGHGDALIAILPSFPGIKNVGHGDALIAILPSFPGIKKLLAITDISTCITICKLHY
ncbi:hypothetical protein L2E82_36129 [Cichorium intybus]|uniref:Uncharacterized protein n=1 Tax=Cichorium intybus TaxID=13427 RepID=A0ACB9BQT1_CICIN|nr:hypothetical protein L2E82_36129 [Cichorium intybus]